MALTGAAGYVSSGTESDSLGESVDRRKKEIEDLTNGVRNPDNNGQIIPDVTVNDYAPSANGERIDTSGGGGKPKQEAVKTKAQKIADHVSIYGSIVSGMATATDMARKWGTGIEKGVEIVGKVTSKIINRVGVARIAITWINVAAGNESVGRGMVQTGIASLGFIPTPYTVGHRLC